MSTAEPAYELVQDGFQDEAPQLDVDFDDEGNPIVVYEHQPAVPFIVDPATGILMGVNACAENASVASNITKVQGIIQSAPGRIENFMDNISNPSTCWEWPDLVDAAYRLDLAVHLDIHRKIRVGVKTGREFGLRHPYDC